MKRSSGYYLYAILSVLLILQGVNLTDASSQNLSDIFIINADTVWNTSMVQASDDVTNSSDALPQNLSDIFIRDADTVWNYSFAPVSEDVIDSSDASPQNLSDIFIRDVDTVWKYSFAPVSEDVIDSSDASPQNLSDIFIRDADTVWNYSFVVTAIPKLNVSIISPPESFSTTAGSELIVKAKVMDGDKLIYNATVEGKLFSISFDLYDDGKSTHGDNIKGDGIYSAKITIPTIEYPTLEINAKYGAKSGSATRKLTIDITPKRPLDVDLKIIDANPPTLKGEKVKVRANISLDGSIVTDAEVNATIILPNLSDEKIMLENKGNYYECEYTVSQAGKYIFDVVAKKPDAIPGYDTKNLKVYHGYLSISQFDTGTTFKRGEPVEFKVEVTCSGERINNAEVRMKIQPDNKEIGLTRYEDGKYKASYRFTTPGVRNINFSANAQFYISAEIKGNSIEIKEEDYELKKTVEEFAADNIEILNATRWDASNLSIAGDYFFSKIDEDAAEGIASLIAKPIAYLTTEFLFPSKYYNEWYEELFKSASEELLELYEKEGLEKTLSKYFKESDSPFFTSFKTHLMSVSKFRSDINKAKENTLLNLPTIPEDQKSIYIEDLNERSKANNRIKDLISKEVEFPYAVYEARFAGDTDWKKEFIGDVGKIGIGIAVTIIYPPAGIVTLLGEAIYDTCNTVKKLDENGRLVTMTSYAFSDIYVKSKKIKDNTVSGISQFKDAKTPVIPEIEVLNIIDVSEGYWHFAWLVKNEWIEKKCYTNIKVKNNGATPADVWVVAYFPNVIDGGRKRLEPGETEIFRIDYVSPYFKYKPSGGDLVTTLVFSETENGIYLVKDEMRIFSPLLITVLKNPSMKSLASENDKEQPENLTIIANPTETTIAKLNMTTYEVIITATNPFSYPINAEITHNTSSWNVSIPPRETKTLNYTIHPQLGIETTIPPAYMEYFDFQHNATVTFASDTINFTASGIEIKGALPYEISDYVEVNLSITNLVNITNGTFNLTLIGNETFEYNITANIENVSALSVKFGPIDVPEGDYVGILTFGWDDDNLTVDARNMQKSMPITIFDTGAPANPYPSIFGTHNGTIKTNQTITVNKLYTYSCPGTGGHTEYAMIWNNTIGECAVAEWNGYGGDYHNITFNKTLTLEEGVIYNYTIRTGSYPQISHAISKEAIAGAGKITCDKFIDANGRVYYDWIPAIKLYF